MAVKLKVFPPRVHKGGNTTVSKYVKYLDGHIWKLVKGTDFQGDSRHVRSTIYNVARSRHIKVRVSILDPTTVIVQGKKA